MFRRKGISSILGVLIFIGILFSAVMPMFLMMRQSDVYYEQAKLEVNRLDEEKQLEDLKVYVSPVDNQFTLTLVNNGEVPLKILRVWENENPTTENELILIQDTSELGPISFSHTPAENENFEIRVTTERGNSFLNENGMLTYGDGEWMLEKYYIIIHAGDLFLHVKVTNETNPSEVYLDEWDTIGVGYQVEVPRAGEMYEYRVLVEQKFLWWTETIYDAAVSIDWPDETYIEIYPE